MTDKTKAAAKAAEQEQEDQDTPEERRFDETVPGGKYLATDGKTFVDANGEPLKGKGDA